MQKYNPKSKESIKKFAELLVWKKLSDFLPKDFVDKTKSNKWSLWNLIQEYYFGIPVNNKPEPDFVDAKIELKATPIKRLKKWEIRPKERLVLWMINYEKIITEKWESSSFLKKNSLLLLIFYFYEKWLLNINLVIKIVEYYSFTDFEEDTNIIKKDWESIKEKIFQWRAHELSEWDTFYLWACTKWETAESSLKKQPNSNIMAKWRAFSFKPWYIRYILKQFETRNTKYEKLFKNNELDSNDFYTVLTDKFKPFIWKTAYQIWENFWLTYKKQKNFYARLSSKIMWVADMKNTEEFIKANIELKTIRITPSNSLKEDISFPYFEFKEIIEEDWEDSDLYNTLEFQKFFFVIFKITTKTATQFDKLKNWEKNKFLVLDRVVLWNAPSNDIENKAKKVWNKTIEIIKEWVIITPKQNKKWTIFLNNLPSSSTTEMIHVRPHWKNRLDISELPDWRKLTKQCFWINKKYIAKQLWI